MNKYPKPTIEEAVKKIYEYFSKPGARLSYVIEDCGEGRCWYRSPEGRCWYRSPDGAKCAVGVLIPDDAYNPGMEYHSAIRPLYELGWIDTRGYSEAKRDPLANALLTIQSFHDNAEDVEEFLGHLESNFGEYLTA